MCAARSFGNLSSQGSCDHFVPVKKPSGSCAPNCEVFGGCLGERCFFLFPRCDALKFAMLLCVGSLTIDSTCCIPKSSDLLWRNRRRVTSWPNCQSAVLWRCFYCFRRLSLWVPGEKWSWQEEVRRYLVCDPYITCHGWQCRFEAYGK